MDYTAKILVAEDNDFVRMQLVKFLQEEGHDVVESINGEQALEHISKDDDIDIAIVDLRMEPLDGFEFIRSMQANGNDMPVILVTGDDNPDLLNDANKLSVAAVLMKPVQRDRLIKAVSKTIQVMMRKSAGK
jgi:DNA-binding NtrC family response regulator